MRQIGLSQGKGELINVWIQTTLADPGALATSGRENGPLVAAGRDLGLDWARIGIPEESAIIEFYGEAVDYQNLTDSTVEAVIVGYGYGYKLVFKLDRETEVEKKLMLDADRPYGAIRIEKLSENLVLVCQQRA